MNLLKWLLENENSPFLWGGLGIFFLNPEPIKIFISNQKYVNKQKIALMLIFIKDDHINAWRIINGTLFRIKNI